MELSELRERMDEADEKLIEAFCRRMRISAEIAAWKKKNNMPVYDEKREQAVLDKVVNRAEDEFKLDARELYQKLFELSKAYQRRVNARVTGVIGHPVAHSVSPELHGLYGDENYQKFDVLPGELENFIQNTDFSLLNVTIPHKKEAVKFCDEVSENAVRIGSVNTLIRKNGKIFGENTDFYGFQSLCDRNGIKLSGKVLVLGSGGTGVMVCGAVRQAGGQPVMISRTGKNNYENLYLHRDADVIVNATPVGMSPDIEKSPVDLGIFDHLSGVADVIYTPLRTMLLQQAEDLNIPHAGGMFMLCAQAAWSRNFMTGEMPDALAAYERLLRSRQGIALIGMPGSGKTSIGKIVAEKLGKKFVDIDDEIEKSIGCGIPDFFRSKGEEAFRNIETQVLRAFAGEPGLVLSCGGGIVKRPENRALLRFNHRVCRIQRNLTLLPVAGRPLSQGQGVEEIYREREALYQHFSDFAVKNNETAEACAEKIIAEYHDFIKLECDKRNK